MTTQKQITEDFKRLQDSICADLEQLDGKARFKQDKWQHHGGGGGRTRIIQNGDLIERGGVNFSGVQGQLTPMISKALKIEGAEKFYATGVSIVLHPLSPLMPIIHMNVRYFELENGVYWFGGGIDLTPHYINTTDAGAFHRLLKQCCNQHDAGFYSRFKKWADDYFFIHHRNETRGIGGIFFDRLNEKSEEKHDKNSLWNFVLEVGNSFVPAYAPFAKKYKELPYTDAQRQWQLIRRSRYVEFNLVYDRGTKFGLETAGRTDSILMSMPPDARWVYCYEPAADSPEAQTLSLLKKEVDWVGF